MSRVFKQTYGIELAALVVAIAFSIAYILLGWYQYRSWHDVVLIVLWLIVIGSLIHALRARSTLRREMIRRFYVSDEWLYNHEIGYAPLNKIAPHHDAYEFVTSSADSLARMSYGFDVADAPEKFAPKLMISSNTFKFHFVGEEDTTENSSVVIDAWKGNLYKIEANDDDNSIYCLLGSYSNAKELALLLCQNGAVDFK